MLGYGRGITRLHGIHGDLFLIITAERFSSLKVLGYGRGITRLHGIHGDLFLLK